MNKIIGLSLLIIVIVLSLCSAQELRIFRLSDKVGYIIDSVEREEYNLFPGLSNFEFARILIKNESTHYADITFRYKDSLAHFYIKLTPRELERLIFCIENSERIKNQTSQDKYALLAYNRFWNQIETRQISCLGGDDWGDDSWNPLFTDDEKRIPLGLLHGMTVGSAIGGFIGAHLGIKENENYQMSQIAQDITQEELLDMCCLAPFEQCCVEPRERPCEFCFSSTCGELTSTPQHFPYEVNNAIFWSASLIGTVGGAVVGYGLEKLIKKDEMEEYDYSETSDNFNLLKIFAINVGCLAGAGLGYYLGVSHFGKLDASSDYNSSPTIIPGWITGICVGIEIIYLVHTVGKIISRKNSQASIKKKIINQKFCDSERNSVDSDNNNNPLVKSE